MLTVKNALCSTGLTVLLVTLTACVSAPHTHQPADEVATKVLAPIATWNPVPGQSSNPGSAASGRLDEHNGHFQTQQTFEVWNTSGAPLPDSIRQRHEQGSSNYPHRWY